MPKRKIFISIPWFHPAFRAGGPVQSIANMVKELDNDFEFRIFCGNTDLNSTTLENIETGKWVFYNKSTLVWYAGPENRSQSILNQLKITKPDILFIIGMFSWHFNIVPLIFSGVKNKIFSVRGMLHPGALSQKKLKKQLFIVCWKICNLHKNAIFHATDIEEENYIKKIFGNNINISIASNFPRKFTAVNSINKQSGSLKLLSMALISSMKNILLVLHALENCIYKIEYNICGPVKDMEYWHQCMLQIKKLPNNITINYHGEVQPQLVQGYFDKCHVFILPSKSENFGHAIYEALTAGKPVITSNFTPWQGLEKCKAGLNVQTDIHAIKNAIDFFAVMQNKELETWSSAAIAYANKAIDLEMVKSQYLKMFFQLD